MEQWEIELRAKLDKEIPDGIYEIGGPNMVALTGKGGKINYEVALVKAAKEYTVSYSSKGWEDRCFSAKYTELKEEDIKDFIKMIEDRQNGLH